MDAQTTEMTPPGATPGPRYAAHFRVRQYEMDALGHVNNAVYLHYLEQAATEHSVAAGYSAVRLRALGGTFVVRRHEIDYLRPASGDDVLQVLTWAEAFRGARAFRGYAIHHLGADDDRTDRFVPPDYAPPGPPLVTARTLWVWFDIATNRPRRLPSEMYPAFLGVTHRG